MICPYKQNLFTVFLPLVNINSSLPQYLIKTAELFSAIQQQLHHTKINTVHTAPHYIKHTTLNTKHTTQHYNTNFTNCIKLQRLCHSTNSSTLHYTLHYTLYTGCIVFPYIPWQDNYSLDVGKESGSMGVGYLSRSSTVFVICAQLYRAVGSGQCILYWMLIMY